MAGHTPQFTATNKKKLSTAIAFNDSLAEAYGDPTHSVTPAVAFVYEATDG